LGMRRKGRQQEYGRQLLDCRKMDTEGMARIVRRLEEIAA